MDAVINMIWHALAGSLTYEREIMLPVASKFSSGAQTSVVQPQLHFYFLSYYTGIHQSFRPLLHCVISLSSSGYRFYIRCSMFPARKWPVVTTVLWKYFQMLNIAVLLRRKSAFSWLPNLNGKVARKATLPQRLSLLRRNDSKTSRFRIITRGAAALGRFLVDRKRKEEKLYGRKNCFSVIRLYNVWCRLWPTMSVNLLYTSCGIPPVMC